MLLLPALVALSACEPTKDDIKPDAVMGADDLNFTVASTTPGGNEIKMTNLMPGVVVQWDHLTGLITATEPETTVVLPFMGDIPIKITAVLNGGQVSKTVTVSITALDHPVAPQWAMFAGTSIEGKAWVWGDGNCYGTNGYGWGVVPSWNTASVGGTADNDLLVDGDQQMVFDLDGGANYTKRTADGTILETGTFAFDMSKTKVMDAEAGTMYSIGELSLTNEATVLCGYDFYSQGSGPISKYDIVAIDDDKLILAWAAPDAVFQDPDWATTNTIWIFKAKE
jgi:hypothetical protein